MGWFGSSSSSNNKNKVSPDGDAVYVDMEANDGLPVAVAVPENSSNSYNHSSNRVTPSAPTATSPTTTSSSAMLDATQQQSQEKQWEPMTKEQALQQARRNRTCAAATATATAATTAHFVSRTPTVIPCCPSCGNRNVRTRIRTAPDVWTWLAVLALALIFWPLCWIPLVTDSCRRTDHHCGKCHAEIGHIRSFQDCCVKHR